MKKRSVGEIVEEIRSTLEGEYREVIIEGEISNLSSSSSGHWYFTLSDNIASIRACLFKMDALRNPAIAKLKDGDKVECVGRIGVYIKRGEFQLICKRIYPAGIGNLKIQFEKLKSRLAADGLFDQECKKEIPKLPKRIAVITAEKAAALQDFLNIYERRSLWMDIIVSPALVQGEGAPLSIIKALHQVILYDQNVTEDQKIDLIVLTRGGGSMEDLWAFNDEALAYEIFNCPIPIISAVGHEVDYTIADYVSDRRAETPSAAAEMLTEEMVTINNRLKNALSSLVRSGEFSYVNAHRKLELIGPKKIVDIILSRFYTLKSKLEKLSRINRYDDFIRISDQYQYLDHLIDNLFRIIDLKINLNKLSLDKSFKVLHALAPHQVLGRGFSYVKRKDGSIVSDHKSFDSLDVGEQLDIVFKDGKGKVNKI